MNKQTELRKMTRKQKIEHLAEEVLSLIDDDMKEQMALDSLKQEYSTFTSKELETEAKEQAVEWPTD